MHPQRKERGREIKGQAIDLLGITCATTTTHCGREGGREEKKREENKERETDKEWGREVV